MAFDSAFCSVESRRIEEIKDGHEEKFVKRFATYFNNIGGKHEIRPQRGNLHISHIQLVWE
jgi:hypothetical protein